MKAKYLLLLPILFFLQSCFVSEKSLYNEEIKGNTTITKVNVPMFLVKPYIKKALKEDGESKEVINLIRKIKRVKVYTVENATEKMATNFSRQSFGNNLQESYKTENFYAVLIRQDKLDKEVKHIVERRKTISPKANKGRKAEN